MRIDFERPVKIQTQKFLYCNSRYDKEILSNPLSKLSLANKSIVSPSPELLRGREGRIQGWLPLWHVPTLFVVAILFLMHESTLQKHYEIAKPPDFLGASATTWDQFC